MWRHAFRVILLGLLVTACAGRLEYTPPSSIPANPELGNG